MPWIFILFYNIFFQPCRNYKREAELARMAWKVNPQDLLPTQFGAKGQFGSRFSLGRLSLPVMKKDVVFVIGPVHFHHLSSSSMDVIHWWGFSIHGWHPLMTLSSMDDPWMELSSVRFCSYFTKFWVILAKIGNLCEQNGMDDNSIHGWRNIIQLEKPHPWM